MGQELASIEDIKKEISTIDFKKEIKETPVQQIEPKREEDKTQGAVIVEELEKVAVIGVAKNDSDVQEKIVDHAKKTINDELDILEKKQQTRMQEAHYDANKEACNNYGIDSSVSTWKVNMMKIGSNIWFVVYFIVATFTICPFNVFLKGIRAFIKSAWLSVIIAFIVYLIVFVGLPVLLAWLASNGYQIN